MAATVFLSHASKDKKMADTICAAIESRGVECWMATRDIHPGENFQEAIVRAIRATKVMLFVFSANSNNSDEVKKEIALAGQNKLFVIPVRVEDVAPNEAFAYEFATRQWIDLFNDWEASLDQLMTQIKAVTAMQTPADEAGDADKPGGTGDAAETPPRASTPVAHLHFSTVRSKFSPNSNAHWHPAAPAQWLRLIHSRPHRDDAAPIARRRDESVPPPDSAPAVTPRETGSPPRSIDCAAPESFPTRFASPPAAEPVPPRAASLSEPRPPAADSKFAPACDGPRHSQEQS